MITLPRLMFVVLTNIDSDVCADADADANLDVCAALGTGIGLGVVRGGRVETGSRGLIEGGHMVRQIAD